MDQQLRNLQRSALFDPIAKDRYIRTLERIVGLSEQSVEGSMKCVAKPCPNQADQGYGVFFITQPNTPGLAPYTWDNAVGPFFICGPCYRRLQDGWTRRDDRGYPLAGNLEELDGG